MSAPRFHDLTVARVNPEAAGAVSITFAVPDELQESFHFQPGQFLTLRTTIDGQEVRRNYSICSTSSKYSQHKQLEVGIRPMEGGLFSNWAATQLKAGDTLAVMPPDGRFVIKKPRALHRVGFAAGSGITTILSIIASTMEDSDTAKFTLVYGNRRMSSVMFNEALQDLKDKYKNRLTLIHILSRQAQEVPMLEGRIDGAKVQQLIDTLLPARSMDEVFICGPEAMIDAAETALLKAGVPQDRTQEIVLAGPHSVFEGDANKAVLSKALREFLTQPVTNRQQSLGLDRQYLPGQCYRHVVASRSTTQRPVVRPASMAMISSSSRCRETTRLIGPRSNCHSPASFPQTRRRRSIGLLAE